MSDTLVAGVDPSTKSGFVVLGQDGTLIDSKHLLFVDARGCKRLQLIAQSISSLLEQHKPQVVSIEGLGYANRFTKIEMAQIGAIIRLECWRQGLSWWDVPPTVLKKWTTGKGNALKKDMAKAVREKWGFVSKSDDVVDAYALARIGLHVEYNGADHLKGVKKFSN